MESKEDTHKRQEGKRLKEGTGASIADASHKIGGDLKFTKKPAFLEERQKYFEELLAVQQQKYAEMPQQPIKIVLPNGNVKEGVSFKTTPLEIAKSISNSLPDKVCVAKVKYSNRIATLDDGLINPDAGKGDGADQWLQWDSFRPLEGDCEIKLLTFEDEEGKMVFWHSSAHVLGSCMERDFGVHLCHGPPTESGFFYDAYTGSDIFKAEDFKTIEEQAKKIVSEKQSFQRLILTKEEALKLFAFNPFKVQLISSKIPEGGKVTCYRNGDLIDLCTGPHVPSTQRIKAFKVMKNAAAYWLGNAENDSLQRVYGVTFPSKKELDEYIHLLEEAAKRDHRNIGKQQELFSFHGLSPGSGFFHPQGAKIYNKLITFMRNEYRARGYQEVISPNVFNLKLWKTSGHYKNYKENIFMLKVENQGFGMKPMNCPGHCLMFDNSIRSYRELPLRLADFGVLHRNEISGALSGLTRVRRFQQDDAHIFCAPEQIMEEVLGCLDFLDYVYGIFGFHFELELSTRPENKLGDDALWDSAEGALTEALNKFGKPWKLNPGDGAFYGPKIDIKVFDALKRPHQCGTVQLDFQLPIRFNLQFKTDQSEDQAQTQEEKKTIDDEIKKNLKHETYAKDEYDDEEYKWEEHQVKPGFKRPVIVHRAILGSVERFMAILIEHLAGKWPFWISPRQVLVCPVSEKFIDYAQKIYLYLHQKGYEVALDRSNNTLPKKIRTGQIEQYNYILVCGEDEMKIGAVDVRSRDNERIGKMRVDKVHEMFEGLMPPKSKNFDELYTKVWRPEDYPEVAAQEEAKEGEKKEEQAAQ